MSPGPRVVTLTANHSIDRTLELRKAVADALRWWEE